MHPNWHVDHMTMSMTSNCLIARHKHLWLGFRGREKEVDLSISVNSWYSRLQSLQKTPLPPKIRHNHLLQQHLTRILKATWTLTYHPGTNWGANILLGTCLSAHLKGLQSTKSYFPTTPLHDINCHRGGLQDHLPLFYPTYVPMKLWRKLHNTFKINMTMSVVITLWDSLTMIQIITFTKHKWHIRKTSHLQAEHNKTPPPSPEIWCRLEEIFWQCLHTSNCWQSSPSPWKYSACSFGKPQCLNFLLFDARTVMSR